MKNNEEHILEILSNLNWLLEQHKSRAELLEFKDNRAVIRSTGPCSTCRLNCVGAIFKESMPHIELVMNTHNVSLNEDVMSLIK